MSDKDKKNELKNSSNMVEIIEVISEKVEPVIKIITTIAERTLKVNEVQTQYKIKMAWIVVAIITLIVIVSGILTYVGKLDGSTFGFLLGLIVGYMLTFVRDSIRKSPED